MHQWVVDLKHSVPDEQTEKQKSLGSLSLQQSFIRCEIHRSHEQTGIWRCLNGETDQSKYREVLNYDSGSLICQRFSREVRCLPERRASPSTVGWCRLLGFFQNVCQLSEFPVLKTPRWQAAAEWQQTVKHVATSGRDQRKLQHCFGKLSHWSNATLVTLIAVIMCQFSCIWTFLTRRLLPGRM